MNPVNVVGLPDDPVERLKKSLRAIATRGGCRSPACMDFALTTRQSWHRLKAPRPFWRGGRVLVAGADC